MEITRRDILKAIRTEKLKAGSFVEIRVDEKPCKVCAVGAVLRNKGFQDQTISIIGDSLMMIYPVSSEGNEYEALDKKLYLNALSIKFEKLVESYGCGKRTREKLAEFVKDNFPKIIKE